MDKRRGEDRRGILSFGTDLAVLAVAVIVLARSTPSLNSWWEERKARIETEKTIADMWTELIEDGARLGTGTDEVIIEFADYQCPYCGLAHKVLDELLAANSDLAVVYRHMPLTRIHPRAAEAARASICAEQTGFFNEVHTFLYETDDWADESDWVRIAGEAGIVDPTSFMDCLDSDATRNRLARDRRLAERLGLRATPSFVGPGGIHVGVLDPQSLDRILKRSLER